MRKILFFILAVILSIAWAAEKKIVVAGIGLTQREALIEAQRNAVEQGVGVLVDSQSLSENLMLVEDRIYAKARGYVKNFKVISEKRMNDGNWEVTIECEVSQEQIKNSLEALGILRDKIGNPRIMVINDTKNTDGILQNNNAVISEAYEGIVEYLTEKEFPVVDKKNTSLGLDKEAEYILVYNIKPTGREYTDIFKKAWVMISAKIINTSSGQVIASEDKKVMGADKDSMDFAYRKAARKAGRLIAQFLEDKFVKRWGQESISGRVVILELANIKNFSQLVEFIDQLKKFFGIRNVIQRNSTPTEVEYELIYVGDSDSLKKNVYDLLKKMGLNPKAPISYGDRIRIEITPSKE